jgi:hypothetical protein
VGSLHLETMPLLKWVTIHLINELPKNLWKCQFGIAVGLDPKWVANRNQQGTYLRRK